MLNVALMGCGRISERHAELLGSGQIQWARLTAVCDLDLSKARRLGERYSIPYFDNVAEMMLCHQIDVVSVLTESGNHASDVCEVAAAGKHVIVEKPMALSLEDADKMIAACEEANVELFVVKQNRHNLPVMKLKQAVEENRLGELILGTVRVRWCRKQEYYDQASWRGTWQMDGGVIANQASHHIDLLQWIMGDVESVFARSSQAIADIEAEDTMIVSLKFKNGALGIIEATTASRPKDLEGSISILGNKGSVVIGGFSVNRMEQWQFEQQNQKDELILSEYTENPPDVYGFGHRKYYESVVQYLLKKNNHGVASVVSGYEGRKSLKLISAIYESIEENREIFLENSLGSKRLGSKPSTS